MICKDVQRCVHAYIDAELEPQQLLELDAHLSNCVECQQLVEFERWFKGELQDTIGRFSAPEGLSTQIRASLDRAERLQTLQSILPRVGVAAAIALGVIAALLLPSFLSSTVDDEPASAGQHQVVDFVAKQHARSLPLEVSGPDANNVASWFRGKVDFAVQPPLFNSEQVKLVGGRLSNVGTQQAAYLFYEHNGRPLTVVVYDGQTHTPVGGIPHQAGNRAVYVGQSRGYNVAMWNQGGVSYAVSSELDQNDMIRLVSSAR